MEIAEKWNAFERAVKMQVKKQCRQIEEAGLTEQETDYAAYEETLRQWKETWLAAEKEKYRLFFLEEKNRHIMECRMECRSLEMKCEEELFWLVEKGLAQFKTTDAYKRRMTEWITEAAMLADGQELEIKISPSDEALLPVLTQQTGIPLLVSGEEFLGGIRCRIPAANRYLEESFAEKLRRRREEWNGWQ